PALTRSTASSIASTPMGNSRSKYTEPSESSGPIWVFFCSSTSPVSSPLSGQKIDSPVSLSPWMIGQLIALGPRYFGSSEGWYWIEPLVGILRNSSGKNSVTKAITCRSGLSALNSGHHARLRLAVGGGLVDRKLRRERRLLERFGLRALFLGRHVDCDDVLAALAQRLQHRLAERLLAVHHDTHSTSSLPSSRPSEAAAGIH